MIPINNFQKQYSQKSKISRKAIWAKGKPNSDEDCFKSTLAFLEILIWMNLYFLRKKKSPQLPFPPK